MSGAAVLEELFTVIRSDYDDRFIEDSVTS